jgi:hypothetical protein
LLFTTNFLAILLAGGVTFWVVGLRRLALGVTVYNVLQKLPGPSL